MRLNTLATIESSGDNGPLRIRLSIAQTGGYVGPDGIKRGVYTRIWAIAEGGAGGYVRTIIDGSLPTGMGPMDPATGESYGTPSATGRWEFTVRAQDSSATVAEARFAVRVLSPLVVVEAAPVIGEVTVPYRYQLAVRGNAGAVTWALRSGNLPSGLSLSSAGVVSGTPAPAAEGMSYATVRAMDTGSGDTLDIALVFEIAPELTWVGTGGPASGNVQILPPYMVGRSITNPLEGLWTGGVPPYAIIPDDEADPYGGNSWPFEGGAVRQHGKDGAWWGYRATATRVIWPSASPGRFQLRDALGKVARIIFGATSVSEGGGLVIQEEGEQEIITEPRILLSGTAVTSVSRTSGGVHIQLDGGQGTVTDVGLSGGSTGLDVTGSPVTDSGTMTLGGVLSIEHGGTGAVTPEQARLNIGAMHDTTVPVYKGGTGSVTAHGARIALNAMEDTTVPINKGGTGATTAAAARTALGALGNVTGTAPITVTGTGDTRTVAHGNSGAVAGTYVNATLTINAQGHVTSASSGTAGGAWGSITGNISAQSDLMAALNAKGGLATSNTWTQTQSMLFGQHDRVYFRTNMGALSPHTNNGGAIYLGVGITSVGIPTAAIEANWGGATQPQLHIGVTREGKKAFISFYASATIGYGIILGHGEEEWLNLHIGGALFSKRITAPSVAVEGGTVNQLMNANGTLRSITISNVSPSGVPTPGAIHFRV